MDIDSGLDDCSPTKLIDRAVSEAIETGLVMQTAGNPEGTNRHVRIDDASLLNFGTCSYLGLDSRRELKDAAIDAIHSMGTQFSISRAYLQLPLYVELEKNLGLMTQGNALVAPTTTLGHIAALPILVGPRDALIVDQFAHASLQTAVGLVHAAAVHQVRHSRISTLEKLVKKLSEVHHRVWYVADGLYSMLGDFAPVQELKAMLAAFPTLHLYMDDAHSTSWCGKHGRGSVLEQLGVHERVVVALSLNKAFACAGGAVIFPSAELYGEVRRCGGPMIFSGPVQPPLLAAAVASSRLHLSPGFESLQTQEIQRITQAHQLAADHGVPLGSNCLTPIFFVPCGPEDKAIELVGSLRRLGFYTSLSAYPAVPRHHAGLRFTVSLHNEPEDIDALMQALGREIGKLGISRHDGHRSKSPWQVAS